MNDNDKKYEAWLTTIANTRLLFNRMEELEDMFDIQSIHNNGMKRSFPTYQRMRGAFRDLMVEAFEQTNYSVYLDQLLIDYKKAWEFYKHKLARRTNPETIPMDLLNFFCSPNMGDTVPKKRQEIFRMAAEQDVDFTILLLLQMKALPGYDSKEGDVEDFAVVYEKVMQLLENFSGSGVFEVPPAINRARIEKNKTRLMLYYHVLCILNVYRSFTKKMNMYDLSTDLKASLLPLDLEGIWNECGGTSQLTRFWQFEQTESNACYFATLWKKDADNNLKGIRYTIFCMEGDNGNMVVYMMHPLSMRHRIEGKAYSDIDHAWYTMPAPESLHPSELPLKRLLPSSVWKHEINLTRVTDEKTLALYNRWLHKDCVVIDVYEQDRYLFLQKLYAVTSTHLYISSENEGEYFKVPRDSREGFDRIQIGDNVGILKMGDETYLAFDEFLLYIPITDSELKKYGIERVKGIE